jgi:hypothetical protein
VRDKNYNKQEISSKRFNRRAATNNEHKLKCMNHKLELGFLRSCRTFYLPFIVAVYHLSCDAQLRKKMRGARVKYELRWMTGLAAS